MKGYWETGFTSLKVSHRLFTSNNNTNLLTNNIIILIYLLLLIILTIDYLLIIKGKAKAAIILTKWSNLILPIKGQNGIMCFLIWYVERSIALPMLYSYKKTVFKLILILSNNEKWPHKSKSEKQLGWPLQT